MGRGTKRERKSKSKRETRRKNNPVAFVSFQSLYPPSNDTSTSAALRTDLTNKNARTLERCEADVGWLLSLSSLVGQMTMDDAFQFGWLRPPPDLHDSPQQDGIYLATIALRRSIAMHTPGSQSHAIDCKIPSVFWAHCFEKPVAHLLSSLVAQLVWRHTIARSLGSPRVLPSPGRSFGGHVLSYRDPLSLPPCAWAAKHD